MSTISSSVFRINGVLSSDKTVMQNLETLCNATGTWLTYDIHQGKWAFIINRAGTSVASFNDSNIIGSISLTGTGLHELYNAVRVEFPHIDLKDEKEYIRVEIPSADRNENEPNNTLNISYDILNNPVQAELLGLIELKQNRVDKIITFNTDYSYLGLKAGDIIDITNTVYDFTNKEFRIVSITENDGDDGSLNLSITALEYDANVYLTSDINRYSVTSSTGIASLGSLGSPGTPTITKYEVASRPRILVESTAPTGVVEGMELWYTADTSVVFDENRRYTLISTVKPTTGNTFVYGDQVEFDVDNLNSGNLFVKTRAFNSSTTGPFSTPSGTVYTPVQTTDAIGDSAVLDQNNNTIGSLLGANALLWLLNQLMSGNKDNTSILGGLGDLFGITGNTANAIVTSTSGATSIVHASKYNAITLTKGTATTVTLTSVVLPYAGTYKVRYFINWGGGYGATPLRIWKNSTIIIPGKTLGPWSSTGDDDVPKFEDHNVEGFFTGTAGETISLQFEYYTEDINEIGLYSTQVWIIAEITAVPSQYGV